MQNQMCRVCEEPAAGFHFGAFTCEGCKSFFGRTCNNQSVIQECKNNYRCTVDKKNRTACKACRLRKCLMVGMSKSGSRYGRRSNWFKIHCLMQQSMGGGKSKGGHGGSGGPPSVAPSMSTEVSPMSSSSLSPTSPPPRTWNPALPKDNHPHRIESPIHHKSEPIERKSSPDINHLHHSPTMVPRTSSFTSPFASLLPQPPLSASPPTLKLPTVSEAPATSLAASLSPMYSGFPHTFPLMSMPGIHNLPFHKQALLSPLLAHSHLWQMARANPLLAAAQHAQHAQGAVNGRPELDLMAEHKALMERFATAAVAAQQAAAIAAITEANSAQKETVKEVTPASPPTSPKVAAAPQRRSPTSSPPSSPKRSASPQNAPIDLSNKRSDEEDSDMDDISDKGDQQPMFLKKKHLSVRSDLNRNVVHMSSTHAHGHSSGSEADHEEDASDEELDVGENLSR